MKLGFPLLLLEQWRWSEKRQREDEAGGKMGLYQIVEALLMMTNALAILNEDRFLAPNGWGFADMGSGRVSSFKSQFIGLLHAVQYLRVPLVAINCIVIVTNFFL